MVSYDFYQNTYLGSALSETAFPAAAARAEEWLCQLERSCCVAPHGADSRAMAVCAVAEALAAFRKTERIAQTSIGGVSVRYEHSGQLQRALLQTAGIYLDIYRGVG
jgi:hypothetical protein